jgi:hypothetical protein
MLSRYAQIYRDATIQNRQKSAINYRSIRRFCIGIHFDKIKAPANLLGISYPDFYLS